MALCWDVNGEKQIEIPTLITGSDELDGDEFLGVSSAADFEVLVTQVMGWDSSAAFVRDTGVSVEELLGKLFIVQRDRVYIKDNDE